MSRAQRRRRSRSSSQRQTPQRREHPILRRRNLLLGIGILVLVPVVAVAWWLGSPLFISKTVEEEFPFPLSANAKVPSSMTQAQVEQSMATWSKIDQEVMEPMPPIMVKADAPAMGDSSPPLAATPPVTATPAAESAEAAGRPVTAPVRLKSGEFQDGDAFHKGSGSATIYRGTDGSLLLRLENFRVTNGPGLHVILSTELTPGHRLLSGEAPYFDLGQLKGNIGNQNYAIPEGTDAGAVRSVVIYCLPFQVVFSVAVLK